MPESSKHYYDAADFRADAWNDLKRLALRIERRTLSGRETDDIEAEIARTLNTLETLETYWAFPGRRACRHLRGLLERRLYPSLVRHTEHIVRYFIGDIYRARDASDILSDDIGGDRAQPDDNGPVGASGSRPYFEVLVVDEMEPEESSEVRRRMLEMRTEQDDFIYDVVVVGNFQDALIAIFFNHNIQSVVLRYSFPFESSTTLPLLRDYLDRVNLDAFRGGDLQSGVQLGSILLDVRPELDLFLVTDDPVRSLAGHAGKSFRRIFYQQEDYLELHLSILRGIEERVDTPFFDALREHSRRPTGVFHAMPISRGKSIMKSHWIKDMSDFYGMNIFLAETSATTGGLDSLLQPHGPIKEAQEKAARAFGARHSYFVTNGTSTANKIVLQALLEPGDIVLVSRDCHKSHHYAIMLAGAYPLYMDPYPLQSYSFYGAVSLDQMKRYLLELRRDGKLDRVRMLLLTNCTFDGLVYHPERVMSEILAIKPDMIFVWDEAWFAFARFQPEYRERTAMQAAQRLKDRFRDPAYRERYQQWKAEARIEERWDDEALLNEALLPDPEQSRVRVYVTQSTHKTLTSLRQGSMIHVADQDFERDVEIAFDEAYMTHTSTSPNYQILASLDVGRRQVELEGYELVMDSIALAMTLREGIAANPDLNKYFQVLKPRDLIPAQYRSSGFEEFYSPQAGYTAMTQSWREDEFVVDPTRITLHIGHTGIDGDTLKKVLMDRFDIQINKTSRNTLLFMLNIGTNRGAIAYLLEVLMRIARDLDEERETENDIERARTLDKIAGLTTRLPDLPDFSRFHRAFRRGQAGETPEGNLRQPFFMGLNLSNCDFISIATALEAVQGGDTLVSAAFVTPYPPGFPVLVPGQVMSEEILFYLSVLDVKEIHGYDAEFGLRVIRPAVLEKLVEAGDREALPLETD